MSLCYLSFDADYQSCTTKLEILDKIDAIILALLTTALKSVQKGDKVEVSLDDGQSKTKVIYSSMASVTQAIKDYRAIRAAYALELSGRQHRNIDSRNLR